MQITLTNLEKIHQANLTSLGKVPKPNWKPTRTWADEQLHAQHSTLEMADLFIIADVSGTTASHIVRATKGHPRFVVESHRPDWTGKARPPASVERMLFIKTSPYAWVEMCRQRLCMLSAQETRQFFYDASMVMEQSDDVMLQALGAYAMPDCMYRGNVCHMHRKAWESCRMVGHWAG